jgi:hypothetical protein
MKKMCAATAVRPVHALLLLALLAPFGAAPLAAQAVPPERLPEPLLRETPWGDFPLERLLPGARLRLTSADGQRVERRLLTLGDSTVELRTPSGDSALTVSFTTLHAYRRIEVRAIPRWGDRVGTASTISGTLLGGLAGAVIHNTRKPSSAAVHRRSRLDDIASVATIGGLVGWEIGIHTLGRPRWRPVTLP